MIIVTDKYRVHIGWRFILRWHGIVRAAARHYTHGTVYILGIPMMSW